MHARLQRFLPIVLIALAMQILAPVAACWASAISASDPLQTAVICHDASATGDTDQGDGQSAHAGSCAICCLAQADFWLNVPQPSAAMPARDADPVAWHEAAVSVAVFRTGANAQARAPPSLS